MPTVPAFDCLLADCSARGVAGEIAHRLGEDGLVTVAGLTSRAAVRAFAARIMSMVMHRDSDADGLTTIRATDELGARPGYAGFGTGALAPHTERSSIAVPPRLMLLVCARPAEDGGESLLADGRGVYHDLFQHHPDAVAALSQPRTAYFGAGDGHATQVFTVHDDATVSIRLRLDALARFSPLVQPYLTDLHAAIRRNRLCLPLAAGQGYLLDNRRWLHARTPFAGSRFCWRALGAARGFALSPGFTAQTVPHPALQPSR